MQQKNRRISFTITLQKVQYASPELSLKIPQTTCFEINTVVRDVGSGVIQIISLLLGGHSKSVLLLNTCLDALTRESVNAIMNYHTHIVSYPFTGYTV